MRYDAIQVDGWGNTLAERGDPGKRFANSMRKKLFIAVSYFFFAVFLEFFTFVELGLGVAPHYWWLDISLIFLLSVFVFVLPGSIFQIVAAMLLLTVQSLLAITNQTLYGMSNMIFDLSLLQAAGEAGNAMTANMFDFGFIVVIVLLLAVELTAFLAINGRWKIGMFLTRQVAVFLAAMYIFGALSGVSFFQLMLNTLHEADPEDPFYIYSDDTYLWETQFITEKAYREFGTFPFYLKNIANYFSSGTDDATASDVEQFLNEGGWNSSLQPYEGYDEIMSGRFAGQNVVLIVIESGEWYGINEYTPTLFAMASQGLAMTEYYAKDKTNHSEALSVLGSYPLESNVTDIIDHKFDFSIANILNASDYTTNYFHTNNGPYYEREKTHGELYGFDNLFFMDTMYRLKGRYVKSSWFDFDNDSEVFSQYMDEFSHVDKEDAAFFTMMMTLFTHGHYEDLVQYGDYTADLTEAAKESKKSQYAMKSLVDYYELIDDYPHTFIDSRTAQYFNNKYDQSSNIIDKQLYLYFKRYQAGMMDLDVGLNRLVYELSESDELNNTTFIFYADHNAYYNDITYNIKNVGKGEYWNTSLHNIPFFIWSGSCMDLNVENIYEGLTYSNPYDGVYFDSAYDGEFYYAIDHTVKDPIGGVRIQKYCNSLDILPTMLDLLGFDFNTNLYQGVSVFKEGSSGFVSREVGMFNDKFYFDGNTLWVMAENDGGRVVSIDGQIALEGESLRVMQGGSVRTYAKADFQNAVQVLNGQYGRVYIKYDFEKGKPYFSDAFNSFMADIDRYNKKQTYLEKIYADDFFADHEISYYLGKTE